MRSPCIAILLCLLWVASWPGRARAQDDGVAAAARHYTEAQAAEVHGELVRAAELYELANAQAKAAPTLRGALRMRLRAEHFAVAVTHAATLLRDYPDDPRSRDLAVPLLQRYGPSLVRIEVTCDTPCLPISRTVIAARAPRLDHIFYEMPGELEIAASFGHDRAPARIHRASAGETVRFAFTAPPTPLNPVSKSAQDDGRGLHTSGPMRFPRWVTWTSASVTVALAGASVWSVVDMRRSAGEYDRYAADAEARYRDSRVEVRRTHIMLGAAAGVAAWTLVAAALTRWSTTGDTAAPSLRVSIGSAGRGAYLGVLGAF